MNSNKDEYIPGENQTQIGGVPLGLNNSTSNEDKQDSDTDPEEDNFFTNQVAIKAKRMLLLVSGIVVVGLLALLALDPNLIEPSSSINEFSTPTTGTTIQETEDDLHWSNYVPGELLTMLDLDGFLQQGPTSPIPTSTELNTNKTGSKNVKSKEKKDENEPLDEVADIELTRAPTSSSEEIRSIIPGVEQINAYNQIKNPAPNKQIETELSWSADQEQNWRARIKHRFPYQRLLVVEEVISAQYSESTVILWEAINDQGFWIRMFALMGLADFGLATSIKNLETAVGDASAGELHRFTMKFQHKSTPGQRYILRQLLAYSPARTRQSILKSLNTGNIDSNVNFKTLQTAFESDPSTKVRKLAARLLEEMADRPAEELSPIEIEAQVTEIN